MSVELLLVKISRDFDDMSWQEFALDDDAILCDIPSEPQPGLYEVATILGTSPLSTPPSTPALSDSEVIHPPSKHRSIISAELQSEAIKSKKAIFMQMIVAAEDDLFKALCGALSLCDKSEHQTLQGHISPSIEEQLSGRYNPPPLMHNDNNASSTSVLSPPKHSRTVMHQTGLVQ